MKIHLTICFAFLFIFVHAQKKKSDYIITFDQNWKPCKPEAAAFLAHVQKKNDTTWQWSYYNYTGPILFIETYKDEDATLPNGYFAYFGKKGKIDSSGIAINGKRNGKWYFYGDSIIPQRIKEYAMGILVHDEPSKKDTTTFPGDKEADFKGGTKAWIKYLQNNLQVPERAMTIGAGGTVIIYFTVNSDGKLNDINIIQSVEYSIDMEAIRILNDSPPWIPAEQQGRKVKAYRLQPITIATR